MSQSYCGNDCGGCEQREQLNCPGCRVGPGQKYGAKCDIARCAMEMNVSNCYGCSNAEGCAKRKRRVSAAANRTYMEEKNKEELQRKGNVSALLSKWLTVLFWLAIGALIVTNLCELIVFFLPVDYLGDIVSVIFCIAQALVMFRLGYACYHFRAAGILSLVSVFFTALGVFFDQSLLMVIFGVCELALLIFSVYQEMMGYIQVTEEFGSELSEKWSKLWFAHLIMLGIAGVSIFVFFHSFLAMLLLMTGAVGGLVTSVIKFVLLYRTAMFFREIHEGIQNIAEIN